jgi:hypothetical protein
LSTTPIRSLVRPICAGSTGSANRASTNGRPSTVGSRSPRPSGLKDWKQRMPEEAVGGHYARQRGAEGSAGKTIVAPNVKREAVAHLRSAFEIASCSRRRTTLAIHHPTTNRPDGVTREASYNPSAISAHESRSSCEPDRNGRSGRTGVTVLGLLLAAELLRCR